MKAYNQRIYRPRAAREIYEETGIRVVYETLDSNEAMMVKVNQGGTPYDALYFQVNIRLRND